MLDKKKKKKNTAKVRVGLTRMGRRIIFKPLFKYDNTRGGGGAVESERTSRFLLLLNKLLNERQIFTRNILENSFSRGHSSFLD